MLLGAIEAGGTKMVLAVGDEKGQIYKQKVVKTDTPQNTVPQMVDFFVRNKVDALGIGAFGPVCLDEKKSEYGTILNTPKIAWKGFSWPRAFSDMDIPIGIDTDVNAAALAECTFGCAANLSNVIYVTIGTGVGVGVYLENRLIHGMLHPEAGHILINKRFDDSFDGVCPYHSNCLEGLASGPAIKKRYGADAASLYERNDVWELEADYIAQALSDYIMVYSPDKIILGGGVMNMDKLFELIRHKVKGYVNGYIDSPVVNRMDEYIVPASLMGKQGVMGCLKLANIALRKDRKNE